ncbi:MAG: ABC transporter ATP-binding protein [Thermoflexus hugenholtzii]|jgi:branched-chain amino acid transport system ATP-binding protein|uniref:ABC transporter ATP-binding protein n=1 Tax=Thermoflexus TaxID=1495649 RepID=UPI001C741DF1|nr:MULTISPECIES: ABC transporter ATP-binding protein [Thermoflexus]QWK11602.1 MAG: ABC transporter ATP-binding protein [Thermoflexus hugenholtzii]
MASTGSIHGSRTIQPGEYKKPAQQERGSAPLLEVEGLTKRFQGVIALKDYRLTLREGEILGVIGPNGAGKTTLINLLSGFLKPDEGSIRFRGRDLTRLAVHRIPALGIARTFQNIRLFPSLTALENVMVAMTVHHPPDLDSLLLGFGPGQRRAQRLRERAMDLLAQLGIAHLANRPAAALSYGDQRRVEIARALALEPSLLLLDEPTAGLHPEESEALVEQLRRLHQERSVAIVMVAHDMPVVMRFCPRLHVLSSGTLLAEGTPEEIRNNPLVLEAFLGRARHPGAA